MKKIISLIAAVAQNGVIGRDGTMPWHIPGDLKHFRETTMGHPVIMGRKTWDAIGRLPLEGRLNIVVTHDIPRTNGLSKKQTERLVFAPSLYEAVAIAQKVEGGEVFVIGGETLFRQALALADRIYLTWVHETISGGDTFFPGFDRDREWQETQRSVTHFNQDPGKGIIGYTFVTYEKTKIL